MVCIALALLLGPAIYWLQIARVQADTRDGLYELCISGLDELSQRGLYEAHSQRLSECLDQRYPDPDPYALGWAEWFEGVQITAVICVAVYLLLWVCVATAKWVWRGREAR